MTTDCPKCRVAKKGLCMDHYLDQFRKLHYGNVAGHVAAFGMTVLSDPSVFDNRLADIELQCSIGHKPLGRVKTILTWDGCPICQGKAVRFNQDSAEIRLAEWGWEFVSGVYANKDSVFVAKCQNGHTVTKQHRSFREGCPHCTLNDRTGKSSELIMDMLMEKFTVQDDAVIPELLKYEEKIPVVCPSGHPFEASRRSWVKDKTRCPQCALARNTSVGEAEVLEFVKSLGVFAEPKRIGIYNFDVYVPDRKIAIEFNGLFHHSSARRSKGYHKDKFEYATGQGLQLLQFWEDEWHGSKEIVKSMIMTKLGLGITRIYARDCEVKTPRAETALDFLNKSHLLGAANYSGAVGLYHQGELVMLITLAAHHRNAEEIVISRVCSKLNTIVVGGFSRLLSQVPLRPLSTWSDNRFSGGKVYESLGFIHDSDLAPDYEYVKGSQRFSKQSMRKNLEEKISGKTESVLRTEQGYLKIFDAGKKKWILNA